MAIVLASLFLLVLCLFIFFTGQSYGEGAKSEFVPHVIASAFLGFFTLLLLVFAFIDFRKEEKWRAANCRATLSVEDQSDYDEVLRIFGQDSDELESYVNTVCSP